MAATQAHPHQRHHLHFCGTVQGVGFRYTAQNLALGYNVCGYVRNLGDGSVELVVEGPEDQVESLLADLRRKMNCFIRKVETHVEPATGEFHGFGIRH